LLDKLPDNCSIEDIQYHLYVLEKVRSGLEDARENGAISQEDTESRLSRPTNTSCSRAFSQKPREVRLEAGAMVP
jgi:hypothetical protein